MPTRWHLAFHKAFGIEVVDAADFMLMSEIGTAVFPVSIDGAEFVIRREKFGMTGFEKRAIARFRHSDEREPGLIHPLLTLEVATEIDLDVPLDLDDTKLGAADELVEAFISQAFRALQNFLEAYRDVKYLAGRGTPEWYPERGVSLREMSYHDFRTFLFYSLSQPGRSYVGSFSEGSVMSVTPDNKQLHARVAQQLGDRVPLERVLILRAWEEYFRGDFRGAVVDSASVVEYSLRAIVRHELRERHAGSQNRIERFATETSTRLLATVMLGLFDVGDEEWRERVANVFDIRHALVHNRKRYATEAEARRAVECAEHVLKLAETMPRQSGS